MSRYIDKDKLLDDLNWHAPDEYNAKVNEVITKQPEADVVEVVRCKDCKWWKKQSDDIQGKCTLFGLYPFYPTGSWYCANGERKE